MSDPTTERAESISDLVDKARKLIVEASRTAKQALELAEDDYLHNDDQLRNVVGTLNLAMDMLSREWVTWSDFAAARRRG